MSNTTASTASRSGGIGFFGLLGLLFIGLKLGGVIGWPWIWVLAPFWASLALAGVFFVIAIVLAGLAAVVLVVAEGKGKKGRRR